MRVAPFGHPRISGYVLLPAAFRSLSRPSSAPSAKASALCSSSLDHFSAYASVHMRQRRLPPSPASGCFCFMLCYLAITLDVFLFFVAQIPVESFLLSSGLFLRICGFQGASMPFLMSWRPPALPHRLQCSTIGRPGLNRRVRHGNGCFPRPYRRQIFPASSLNNETHTLGFRSSLLLPSASTCPLERR